MSGEECVRWCQLAEETKACCRIGGTDRGTCGRPAVYVLEIPPGQSDPGGLPCAHLRCAECIEDQMPKGLLRPYRGEPS